MTKVGIEIECENVNEAIRDPDWRPEHEGMLVGGMEYVLKAPLEGEQLTKSVRRFCKKFTTEVFTQRCSTHIHIDVRGMNKTQLFNFITLYVCFEKVILSLVDEQRVGNLFCLPTYESTTVEDVLCEIVRGELRFEDLHLNGWKYSGMNLASIGRLGSLEFRSLHGTSDPDELLTWIGVHLCLQKYAMKDGLTPDQIIMESSFKGSEIFTKEVFDGFFKLFKELDLFDLVQEGVRNAQYFAFAGEWK